VIHALDHVALTVANPGAAGAAMARLTGVAATPVGVGGAWIPLANTALLLCRPEGALATLPAAPSAPGATLAAAGFAVADLDAALRRLARRGLPAGAPFAWTAADGAATRAALLEPAAANGLGLLLVERPAGPASAGLGLDHLVIRTPNPDRAVALFGGRLGLDLRLDRTAEAWRTRFLFFRCGDLVVEVVRRLDEPEGPGADAFSGLAFRAPDIAAERARLAAAGIAASEVRPGRKPGTVLFTVRDPAALVPLIFIGGGAA
jgi:catechol 2,3-dioxygenase-like lactoylglutathione lyase family enzyme